MEENKSVAVIKSIATTIDTISEDFKTKYPEILKSAETAVLHMSKITKVETQDEYDKANALLVKVKATYVKVKAVRESWTKPMDDLKSQLMNPEKLVSLEKAHASSEGNRIKNLMTAFANDQLRKKQQEEAKILKKQNADMERSQVEGRVISNIHTQVSKKVEEIHVNMERFFATITLENFDEKSKSIRVNPKLKQDFYESLFVVHFDQLKLPVEDFQSEIARVKKSLHYDGVNKIYVEKATPIIDSWINKLPGLKVQLNEVAELKKKDAKKAEELQKKNEEKAKFEAQQSRETIAKDAKAAAAEAEREANVKSQDAVFEAQIASQSVQGKPSGVRTKRVAVITAPEDQIVAVIARIVYANFTAPGFTDYIKRDKDGGRIQDSNGNYEYAPWLQQILDEHAKNCELAADGVEFREVASATIRKK